LEQAQPAVNSAKPKTDGIARVIPKCPPKFPDEGPITMTVPDVARQLTESAPTAEFPIRTEQAQSVVNSARPKTDSIARVIPKRPPPSQRTRYSLWQVIMDEFPDGVPITMTVPDVARQLAENKGLIARGIKKKNLMDGKHNMSLKRLLERTHK
jgi:hypothetical protein